MCVFMDSIKFSTEEKILHRLILNANNPNIPSGLLRGKCGIALVLAHYSRERKKKVLENVVSYILDDILNNLYIRDNYDFSCGLSGIGWSIEYLIQNNYIKGCGVDICFDLDQRIMEFNVLKMDPYNFENGFLGLLEYIFAHIQGANMNNKKAFEESYLCDVFDVMKKERKNNSIFWNDKIRIFESLLNGNVGVYNFILSSLIDFNRIDCINKIGLCDGMAGYLELILEGKEHEKYLYSR